MLKLLIVDDSALMRRHLSQLFEAEGGFELSFARNGSEAVAMNKSVQPDVVTLDINMPEMDGISALSLIMAERPVPVIMLSSLTTKGALATFEALNLGAVDFVAKPDGTISRSLDSVAENLVSKVRSVARAKLRISGRATSAPRKAAPSEPRVDKKVVTPPAVAVSADGVGRQDKVILIGVSTGGPRTLEEILPALPEDLPAPIVIAQHMPASFTSSLASRLNRACAMQVEEVNKATALAPGVIYIARGNADVAITTRRNQLYVQSKPEDAEYLWHPSVEILGQSALKHCSPRHVLAVLLTGMGHDGSRAFTELKKRGATTIAESADTAIVFGMPSELIDLGGASKILPAGAIAADIIEFAAR